MLTSFIKKVKSSLIPVENKSLISVYDKRFNKKIRRFDTIKVDIVDITFIKILLTEFTFINYLLRNNKRIDKKRLGSWILIYSKFNISKISLSTHLYPFPFNICAYCINSLKINGNFNQINHLILLYIYELDYFLINMSKELIDIYLLKSRFRNNFMLTYALDENWEYDDEYEWLQDTNGEFISLFKLSCLEYNNNYLKPNDVLDIQLVYCINDNYFSSRLSAEDNIKEFEWDFIYQYDTWEDNINEYEWEYNTNEYNKWVFTWTDQWIYDRPYGPSRESINPVRNNYNNNQNYYASFWFNDPRGIDTTAIIFPSYDDSFSCFIVNEKEFYYDFFLKNPTNYFLMTSDTIYDDFGLLVLETIEHYNLLHSPSITIVKPYNYYDNIQSKSFIKEKYHEEEYNKYNDTYDLKYEEFENFQDKTIQWNLSKHQDKDNYVNNYDRNKVDTKLNLFSINQLKSIYKLRFALLTILSNVMDINILTTNNKYLLLDSLNIKLFSKKYIDEELEPYIITVDNAEFNDNYRDIISLYLKNIKLYPEILQSYTLTELGELIQEQ